MNAKNFIKVTEKGANKSFVTMSGNETFFRSKGAKIETPTESEIYAAFPELNPANRPAAKPAKVDEKAYAELKAKYDEKCAECDALKAESEAAKKRIAELEKSGIPAAPAENPNPDDAGTGEPAPENHDTNEGDGNDASPANDPAAPAEKKTSGRRAKSAK